jgi:hypothetical protein
VSGQLPLPPWLLANLPKYLPPRPEINAGSLWSPYSPLGVAVNGKPFPGQQDVIRTARQQGALAVWPRNHPSAAAISPFDAAMQARNLPALHGLLRSMQPTAANAPHFWAAIRFAIPAEEMTLPQGVVWYDVSKSLAHAFVQRSLTPAIDVYGRVGKVEGIRGADRLKVTPDMYVSSLEPLQLEAHVTRLPPEIQSRAYALLHQAALAATSGAPRGPIQGKPSYL